MKWYSYIVILWFLFLPDRGITQKLFYQDICHCGVTAAGFSTGMGAGSGSFSIYIEPGSVIKKAYLFTYRIGSSPPSVSILINGVPYEFDTSNVIMTVNTLNIYASPIQMYYYDFTDSLNANLTTNFNVSIPFQTGLPINWGYWTISLFVVYENPVLSLTGYSVFINDKDYVGNENYLFKNLNPIDTTNPVGMSVFIDRACDTILDGSVVFINNNNVGVIGGGDMVDNFFGCSGAKGHFYYQNNILYGLDDDIPNNIMQGGDALIDMSSLLNNNDVEFNVLMQYEKYPYVSPGNENFKLLTFLAYTTPCDTFSTQITPALDTICYGDSVQLQAFGGSQYRWWGAFGGLSDTAVANPKASPSQTTTYICTITNDSGCVKTAHAKVVDIPPPDSITVTPTVCGDETGKVIAHVPASSTYNFALYDSLQQPIDTNTNGIFTQLGEQTYVLQSQIKQCTYTDTVSVASVNQTHASFWRTPYKGKAPLTVTFGNQSLNATDYIWQFPSDTFYVKDMVYTFDTGGVYPVCLVAYNNIPRCSDKACYTFYIDDNTQLWLPNVFTPNQDGLNEMFMLSILDGIENIVTVNIVFYNRWGQMIFNNDISLTTPLLPLWDGKNAPEGTYFYTLTIILKNGEQITRKGTVQLLR